MEPINNQGGTSMTPEELLKPRWKVIASYPGCNWHVGAILDRDWGWDGNDEEGFAEHVSDYPHLFRRLEWFEERKEEELPKFVKTPGDDILELVVAGEWYLLNGRTISHKGLSQCVPATETEYNEYLKQKEANNG